MERTDDNDIATAPYKGPGSLVTGAGEGAIAHYGTGLFGLIGGGIASYFAPGFVGKIEDKFVSFSQGNEGKGLLRRAAGGVHKLASEAAHHMPGSQTLLKRVPANRIQAVIFGGGLAGVFGFFIAPLYFFVTGAKHSNDGKVQFREAQDEIITTRAERDALLEKYAAVKTELDVLKTGTAENGPLKVAKDSPPAIDHPHDGSIAALSGVQQDSPDVISKPKIEGPPIQTPTIQNPPIESPTPKNQWWDGKEPPASHAERIAERAAETSQHEARL